MAHRHLREEIIEFHEFSGERLSEVFSEVALFAAVREANCETLYTRQEWNGDQGFVVYVFVSAP